MIPFLLALLVAGVVADVPVENGVYVLGDDNFTTFVSGNSFVLAEFYAPWCGHCKKLEPEYAEAAKALQDTDIKLAKVDATQNKDIAQQHNVQGYPTLKFFVDGVGQEYDGPRDAAGIVSWLKKKTQPPANLETVSELEQLQAAEELLVVGAFHSLDSAKALEFLQASKRMTATVATTTNKEVLSHLGVSGEDQVILLKQYDNLRDDLGSDWDADALVSKVSSLGRRLITPWGEKYQRDIFAPENTRIAFVITNHNDAEQTSKDLACVTEVAKQHREVAFVDLDSADMGSSRVLDYFGLTSDNLGELVVFEPAGGAKYRYSGSGLCNGLEAWVSDYLKGKVDPFLKRQVTPDNWDADYVKILTGYNFNEVAMDNNKHAFVEFYAPWCGHCKQLEPVWNKLGKYFSKRDDIVIAKVDATLNEIPEVPVQSFPTLKFIPKGSSEILDYSGERTYKALKKFVVGHAGPNPKQQ